MPDTLPIFRYHPDPVATKSVVPSNRACNCCGQVRGFIYDAVPYSGECIDNDYRVCPWCIADGSAAARFSATFASDFDYNSPDFGKLSDEVKTEVMTRTPGYTTWQGESWACCCSDACEFHGDAPAAEIQSLTDEDRKARFRDWQPEDEWLTDYAPGGDIGIYKFVCRHCGEIQYNADLS